MLLAEFGHESGDPQCLDVCAILLKRTRGGDGTAQRQLNVDVDVVTC